MTSTSFRYEPLLDPLATIRLIEITGGYRFRGPVRCRIRNVRMEEAGDFIAVSYTWGDPARTHAIKLATADSDGEDARNTSKYNGLLRLFDNQKPEYHDFPVTRNLYELLQNLHDSATQLRDRKIKWFWIDALCINQQDMPERETQVQVMGDIYTKAFWVIVWLGDLDCDHAAKGDESCTCVSIFHLSAAIRWVYKLNDACKRLNVLMSDMPETEEYLPSVRIWLTLVRLFMRPWFSRLWVLQEVTLPPRSQNIAAFCGTLGVSFDALILASQYLSYCDLIQYPMDVSPQLNGILSMARGSALWTCRKLLSQSRKLDVSPSERLLDTLLLSSGIFDCTNERDRVYGLYGLVPSIGSIRALAPDYSKSVDDLYLQVARCLIESTGTLTILSAAPGDRRVPSWVPTWRRRAVAFPPDKYALLRRHTRFNFSACGRLLNARAASLGDIILSIPLSSLAEINDFCSLAATINAVESLLEDEPLLRKRYPTARSLHPDLARAALRQLWGPHKFEPDLVPAYNILRGRESWPGTLEDPGTDVESHLTRIEGFFQTMRAREHGRSLESHIFVTTEGYIGAASRKPPVGSRLYVVPGNFKPIVFVRDGRAWRIHEFSEETPDLAGVELGEKTHMAYLAGLSAWEEITIA